MTELISSPAKEYPALTRAAIGAAEHAGLPRLFELEAEYEESQVAAESRFAPSSSPSLRWRCGS